MTKIDELLREVQHLKAFLSAAEAALSSPHGEDTTKANAASVGIEEAYAGFGNLLKMLAECRGDPRRNPTLSHVEAVNKARGERDAAASAAGKTAN
ncbi:hypothetical protein EVB74_016 [Rhizobium phage RHph_Y3_56_1]|nr:hypothetical protein EVB59_016 [Rhizobium phage RHph_Y3_1]QIG77964.1 hypothetical protein EVB74_016 [Rhizobium phage RHph_Y3_56_1]